jgi:V/A-type H+-transporting ATPase subunit I
LASEGCHYFFYNIGRKEFRRLELQDYIYAIVNEIEGKIYIVFLGRDLDDDLATHFDRVDLGQQTLTELKEEISEKDEEIRGLNERIASYGVCLDSLKLEMAAVKDRLELQKAVNGQEQYADNKLSVLEGWYPRRKEKELLNALSGKGLTYFKSNPTRHDDVPVLLRNDKYSRLFEPITRIFQLPNYYELDLTPIIAVFYPIFFAYCLGDAGYGIVVMLLAVLGWFTFLKNARQMVVLVFLLGAMTAVMGIIKSGSVFGIPLTVDSDVPLFRFLSGFILIPDDQDYVFNAFNVALMFGVLQILIGVIASIINKTIYYSFKEAIPQIGKLFIVVGVLVLFLSRMQSVEALKPFDAAAEILLYAGIGLVLLFNDMTKPVLKRIGGGVLPLFFIFTGILGDILSYVRLFALGVASSVLGLVVNRIGMQIMDESWWSILLGVVFLIFGHSLNLALAALGAFVHPLRLTFVEFYNNAGFSGGGKAYEPLKKELKT